MNPRRCKLPALWLSALLVASGPVSATNARAAELSPTPLAGSLRGNALTVAFWNIQWFPGRRPNASQREAVNQVEAVHRDIVELKADVIGMEEVRDFHRAELAVKPLPGFKVDVCSNFPPREGQVETQQVAIASRLQPLSAWSEMWAPRGAMIPPRGFAFAAYQIAPKQMLLVYVVHLKSNRGELLENVPLREESMRQLLAHMNAMAGAYGNLGTLHWIVGGDFNTAPDDKRFATETTIPQILSGGFHWSWKGIPFPQRITVPADKRYPAACFDHILFRDLTLQRAWVAETSPKSSDHRAIQAIFDL